MAETGTYTNDFTSGAIFPQVIRFAAPLFLANLIQLCYNMVDMTVVGRVAGQAGLSAVSVGGDVANFLTFTAMGFSNAGQVIISQYIGAKRSSEVSKFIGTMFSFLMSCAVILSVICLIFRHQILTVMNTPAEAYSQALQYSTICMAGLIFIYGYNIISAILRGLGDSRHPFLFICLSAGMNVALDLVFVMWLKMGAGGAALATVISQGVSFLCCAWFVFRNREKFGLSFRMQYFTRIDSKMLAAFIKLGVPMALKSASVQFSKLAVNSYINSYGLVVSAFTGIASKINSMGNVASTAINTAGSSMVGQNVGAKNYERVSKILIVLFAVTLTLSFLISVLLVRFPEMVYGLFTDDPDVIALGMTYVPIGVLVLFACACRAPMNALINGSGNSRINLVTAVMDAIVCRIGLAYLFGLGFGLGYRGFWLGDALAGYTPFVVGLIVYVTGKWKKNAVIG